MKHNRLIPRDTAIRYLFEHQGTTLPELATRFDLAETRIRQVLRQGGYMGTYALPRRWCWLCRKRRLLRFFAGKSTRCKDCHRKYSLSRYHARKCNNVVTN